MPSGTGHAPSEHLHGRLLARLGICRAHMGTGTFSTKASNGLISERAGFSYKGGNGPRCGRRGKCSALMSVDVRPLTPGVALAPPEFTSWQ